MWIVATLPGAASQRAAGNAGSTPVLLPKICYAGHSLAMPNKRLLVLANSIKKGGRCVAGRELLDGEVGPWCRPISEAEEGELRPYEMKLGGGSTLRPLQVVDVPVDRAAPTASHPEDWIVTGDEWSVVASEPTAVLETLIEKPQSLWLEAGMPSDRVTAAYLSGPRPFPSLYLIRPEGLRLRYWREHNPFKGYIQKKTRVAFTYNGTGYDMSFTDPVATHSYCTSYPSTSEPAKEISSPFGDECVICVSLTPPLNGVHYKVVASYLGLR